MKAGDITAIVLAAGASSRMWPLGDKHLLRFAGRSLMDVHIERLREAGIRRFVVVASEQNRAALAEQIAGEATVVTQTGAPGMAGSVLSAFRDMAASDVAGPVYITQPLDLVEPSLHAGMLEAAVRGDAYGYLAGYVTEQHFPGGYLVEENGRVVRIVEKPARGEEPSDLVTIVAHLLSDGRALQEKLTREAGAEGRDDAYERALDPLMQQHEVRAVRYEGSWSAVKYPWHVLDAMELLLQQLRDGAFSAGPDYEEVEPGVFVGRDVKMLPGSKLVGPAVVGHGVVIGNNSLVRESMIGDGCVVGFGSEVARSYLGAGCQLHGNYVGDSVFGEGVLLGFGAVTANFRLDGKPVKSTVRGERIDSGREKLGMIAGAGARAGVNASIMPGVKIGADAIVGPGQVVYEDVPDGEALHSERQR